MKKHGYLVVEGPHDVECVGRILGMKNLKRVRFLEDLSFYWSRLIPKQYPPKGDLLKRVQVPTFFQNDTHSVAIHCVSGHNQLVSTLCDTMRNDDALYQEIIGMGIIADADFYDDGAFHRFHELKDALPDAQMWPEQPGKVSNNNPKRGMFIFPNNKENGTLESVLLHCAQQVYPDILRGAEDFVQHVNTDGLHRRDKEDFIKPTGKAKASVGCIANILRPGKAIQVSIQDNSWISEHTLHLPELVALHQFLAQLFDLPE